MKREEWNNEVMIRWCWSCVCVFELNILILWEKLLWIIYNK